MPLPPAPRPKPKLPAVMDPPEAPEAVPAHRSRPRQRLEPRWYVILHNDELHTYEYVIQMLVALFKITPQRAFIHAIEVDTKGVTILARLPKSEAEDKRDQILRYGGDPRHNNDVSMKASIEPCDD